MTTILVTGGAGFIGSNFVHYMTQKYPEYNIIVLDTLTYAGSVDNLPPEFEGNRIAGREFWYGDVTNADLVDSLVQLSDFVVHFAAETHVTRSIFDNKLFFLTDVIGTQTVANAVCRHKNKVQRLIHISTSEVYGTAIAEKMDENHPLNPASPYAAAKVGADRLVYSYWSTYKIPIVIVRPFNNYGPRQHLEKAVPRFITSLLLQEQLHLHGDGSAARDFVYVDDTCSALDLIIHADSDKVVGEVFNVGTGVDRSIKSIADDIITLFGTGSYACIGDRPGQVVRHTADITKITTRLGWQPQISWIAGLKQTISWYNTNGCIWMKQKWLREIPIISASGIREMH